MELWARNCPVILPKFRLPVKFRDLLHAANLRHGTDGFTSPPKEGVLGIFFVVNIRRLRPGLNPRTWVLKASTLPLDHRSRYHRIYPEKLLQYYRMSVNSFYELLGLIGENIVKQDTIIRQNIPPAERLVISF